MARERDEGKRAAILLAAKRLFAERGYRGAGVAEIAREVELPVGSIYTYFSGKDEILQVIVEEGWAAFGAGMAESLAAAPDAAGRLSLLVNRVLPSLFEDLDFISILLSGEGPVDAEGRDLLGLAEKLDTVTELVGRLVREAAAARGRPVDLEPRLARAAICLFFLGSLDSLRLARRAGLALKAEDIVALLEFLVERSLAPEPPSP